MLNLGNSDGDFTPFVKYNAKSGRWYSKGESGEVEIQNPTFVADFDNIQTGWFYFMEGMQPQKTFDPDLTNPAPKPDDNHKRGFAMRLYSDQSFGGVVEFGSTSAIVCNVINELYTQYEAEKGANAGKLPVIESKGAEAVKGKYGTNYKPLLSIVKWTDRPAELDAPANTQTASTTQPAPAASSVSEF